MHQIKIGSNGGKTCHVLIQGLVSENFSAEPILFFKDIVGTSNTLAPVTKMRLDGVQFAIQEKMGFDLWWMMEGDSLELILPLESRGGFDFEKIISIHSPEGARGLAFSCFKVSEPEMSFMLMLDFTKQ